MIGVPFGTCMDVVVVPSRKVSGALSGIAMSWVFLRTAFSWTRNTAMQS